MPVSWTTAWPLPRPISQRLTGTAKAPATTREKERLPQKSSESRPGLHRPGDRDHDRVVDDLHRRDAERVGGEGDRDHRRQRQSGAQQRQAGQGVAEEEGEADGEGDGPQVGEAERGPDRHPGDLADRAAGEAVQGGADGDGGERRPLGRQRVVMAVRQRTRSGNLQRAYPEPGPCAARPPPPASPRVRCG